MSTKGMKIELHSFMNQALLITIVSIIVKQYTSTLDRNIPQEYFTKQYYDRIYRVKSQDRGEIFCYQVATGVTRQFHVTRIYPFTGTEEEAFQLACRDSNQYGVKEILGYGGDALVARKYMTFLVQFVDADQSWIQYGPDLMNNAMYQTYIDTIPELAILKYTSGSWQIHNSYKASGNNSKDCSNCVLHRSSDTRFYKV